MMGCFNNIGKPVDTRDKLGYVKSGILQVSVDCSPIIQPTHKQQPVVLHDRQFQLCPILFIATNFILHPMCIDSYVLPELAVLTVTHPAINTLYLGIWTDYLIRQQWVGFQLGPECPPTHVIGSAILYRIIHTSHATRLQVLMLRPLPLMGIA